MELAQSVESMERRIYPGSAHSECILRGPYKKSELSHLFTKTIAKKHPNPTSPDVTYPAAKPQNLLTVRARTAVCVIKDGAIRTISSLQCGHLMFPIETTQFTCSVRVCPARLQAQE